MIKQVNQEDIPRCAVVIRESFGTVADELGITEENAPRFTAFATTVDRLNWHLHGEHRPMFAFWDRRGSDGAWICLREGAWLRENTHWYRGGKQGLAGVV